MVLWSMSEVSSVSPTGLLPSVVRLSRRLRLQSPLLCDISATPNSQKSVRFGLFPRSLAATEGIEVSFFSSGYLDVSVPPVASRCLMNLGSECPDSARTGCPIRRSPVRCLLATTRGFSQLATSFFGSWCQGLSTLCSL